MYYNWKIGQIFKNTCYTGLHFVIPFVEKCKARIDLREHIFDVRNIVITKDNLSLSFEVSIFYQIVDANKAVYEIKDLTSELSSSLKSILRSWCSNLKYMEVMCFDQSICDEFKNTLNKDSKNWGCIINNIKIKKISPSKDVLDEFARNTISSKKFIKQFSENKQSYQYTTNFNEDIKSGDIVRVLSVNGNQITIEKNNEKF